MNAQLARSMTGPAQFRARFGRSLACQEDDRDEDATALPFLPCRVRHSAVAPFPADRIIWTSREAEARAIELWAPVREAEEAGDDELAERLRREHAAFEAANRVPWPAGLPHEVTEDFAGELRCEGMDRDTWTEAELTELWRMHAPPERDPPPIAPAPNAPNPEPQEPAVNVIHLAQAARPEPIDPTPWRWRDPATIERRQMLYDNHYFRRQVSTTVAPGGVGKSSLGVVEALAMATGLPLLGVPVPEPVTVWLFNLEDPRDEMDRRIAAACLHYGVTPEEIGGRLYVDTGRERELCVTVETRTGVKINEPVMDALAEAILSRGIDVLTIDPFVSSHDAPENDNVAIDRVAKGYAKLADQCNCAIELVHHTRKLNGNLATSEDGRGGSALLAAARSGRVLNRMGDDLREAAGVAADPGTYFAVTRDKANLAPAGKRVWRRTISFDLPNGDSVGVVEAWAWPDDFAEVTTAHLREVLAEVARLADAEEWPRYSSQVRDGWIGEIVGQVVGLCPTNDRKKIARIVENWIATKQLAKANRPGPNRKVVPCIVLGAEASE